MTRAILFTAGTRTEIHPNALILLKLLVGDSAMTARFASSHPIVDEINALEPEFESKSQDDLRSHDPSCATSMRTPADLDDFLPQVFAAAREATKRTIGQRHFDVQIMGGDRLARRQDRRNEDR